MKVKVFIQARMSSSRLPGKVLLPVVGIPLVVLASQRSSRTGLDVTVLTSLDESDDCLCDTLKKWNLPFFRGNLDNVLSRFCEASKDLHDDDIIIRLTADNFLPDGETLDEAIAYFINENCEYLKSSEHFPVGLSFEIFRKSSLDKASVRATSDYDLEHVTSFIRKNSTVTHFKKNEFNCNKRITIDTLEDYLLASRIVSKLGPSGPVQAFVDELKQESATTSSLGKRIILGGAQLGFKYGINATGAFDKAMVKKTISFSQTAGLYGIDTASGYGESEKNIGEFISKNYSHTPLVITKIDHTINFDKPDADWSSQLHLSVIKSMSLLRLSKLPIALFHRADHISAAAGKALLVMKNLKALGFIGRIGVSISNPEEFISASAVNEIEVIQLPYNILDSRWEQPEIQASIASFRERKGEIHVRSAFLQGLLFIKDPSKWPGLNIDYDPEKIIFAFDDFLKKTNVSLVSACLSHVWKQLWIDKIIIGAETVEQIRDTISNINPDLEINGDDLKELRKHVPTELLSPENWR